MTEKFTYASYGLLMDVLECDISIKELLAQGQKLTITQDGENFILKID